MTSHLLLFLLQKLVLKSKNSNLGENFRLKVVQVKLIVKWFQEKATFTALQNICGCVKNQNLIVLLAAQWSKMSFDLTFLILML